MDNPSNSSNRIIEIAVLVLSIVLITLLHYSTMSGSNVLLHEISQRLYYIPIIYGAYRFGIKGSLAVSLFSGVLYWLHIAEHRGDSATAIFNQYAEILMFQVIAIATGIFAQAEKQQRQRFEKASADLAVAYQELKDTVSLLVRAARLKSLGELAATIAHEIRNPLGAIKGAVEIIEGDIPPQSPKREFITVLEREIDRLNRLVNEFLQFAKPRPPEKKLSDINELIKSIVTFISPQAAKSGVQLVLQLDNQLPLVLVDMEQLRQVLLNLLLNAIQAMPDGGKVEVASRTNGEFVEITVRDYGIGIEREQRERIFDPFFSTKPEGSGLGLSVSYQLIKQHGGEIELRDHTGPGSLFSVRLPLESSASIPAEKDAMEHTAATTDEVVERKKASR